MRRLTSPDFRKMYTSLNEPVEVTVFKEPIGRWYPVGTDIEAPPYVSSGPAETEAEPEPEPSRFTIRPALRPKPTLHASQKPVLDPKDMQRQANVREEEYMARTFQRRPAKS